MVPPAIVRFSDGHGVVGEVDIAVVACGVRRGTWKGKVESLQKSGQKLVESLEASEMRVLIFGHFEESLPELWDLYDRTVGIGAGDVEALTFREREKERERDRAAKVSKDATERTASGEASLTPSTTIFTSWSPPSVYILLMLRLRIIV